MNELIILVGLLFTKHFIIDFPLQTAFQLNNKGTYGHLGGVLHSFLHGLGTWLCFIWYKPEVAMWLAIADYGLHYHIDWAKVKLNKKFGWGPTSDKFWWLLGLDQYLHAMTYVLLIYLSTLQF